MQEPRINKSLKKKNTNYLILMFGYGILSRMEVEKKVGGGRWRWRLICPIGALALAASMGRIPPFSSQGSALREAPSPTKGEAPSPTKGVARGVPHQDRQETEGKVKASSIFGHFNKLKKKEKTKQNSTEKVKERNNSGQLVTSRKRRLTASVAKSF